MTMEDNIKRRVSIRITRRTRGHVYYFSRLSNCEVQYLDTSEVNGISVNMKPLRIEVIEHKDIPDECREGVFSILSDILSSRQ